MGSNIHTELPSGWEMIEFGKFTELRKSKYVPNENETLKCLELEHFNQETGDINGWIDSKLQKSAKNVFKNGDVLFGKLRPYLKKYWKAEFDGVTSSEVWVLKSEKKICDTNFLFRLIQTHRFIQVANVSSGSKMPRADWDLVSSFPFALPSLPEQRAIANILSTWDTAIQTTQALISQKEAEKKWFMQNLLTGKKRLKGFSGEWKEYHLSDIFNRVNRKNTEENTNVVTISAQRGFVKQTDFFNKTVASDTLNNYYLVEKGEFCYNKSYSNGYPWGATKRLLDFDKAVVTTLYICFAIRDIKRNSGDFFEHYFEANLLDRGLTRIAHEGGRAHGLLNVTPSDFFNLQITIPSLEEQSAIAQVLQTAGKEIELLKTKLEQQKLQKKGLMQVLLKGKVRVKINDI